MKGFICILSVFLSCSLFGMAKSEQSVKINYNDTIPLLSDSLDIDTLLDNAIVPPESFDESLDSLFSNSYLKFKTHVDPNCVNCNEDISYPDSVYKRRLSILPTFIEMPYNQIVKQYIELYTQRRRKLVECMLGLGNYYFPIFEAALDKEGLPLELKYLPVIESALNPMARSRAGASGPWQFMLFTGRQMGLEINSLVDERCDPVQSSAAAARYLKILYNIYQDWPLAIAAYNCGPGNVNKAILRAKGKKDYWSIYYYLPRETRGYVPAFIAANYVMNYYTAHNLCPLLADFPTSTDTVHLNKPLHLEQVANVLNLPIEQIREMNPHYRRDLIPGDALKTRALCLPSSNIYDFFEHQDSIYAYKADQLLKRTKVDLPGISKSEGASYYKVRKGDTLSDIAQKYRVSVKQLKKWNDMRSDNLSIGKRLIIYN